MRAMLVGSLLLFGGCGHLPPASTADLPPPWPAASPSLPRRATPGESGTAPGGAGTAPTPSAEPAGKTPVPPLKPDILPTKPSPTPPQSD
jgi:hypothetical protein